MKLYTVQYDSDDEGIEGSILQTAWCASIADATKIYNDHEKQDAVIKIVTLPKGREEMAAWLNERGVKV